MSTENTANTETTVPAPTNRAALHPRGAEWRQWDLHVHTPASFHWDGGEYLDRNLASDQNNAWVDAMISAMNDAEPAVFAIMDYWTFDGWFALKRRLAQAGAPELTKTVFPGIELRLMAPTSCRLNAHVLFSDEVPDQVLIDFRQALKVEIIGRPLSDASLVELARAVGEDKLRKHGFSRQEVQSNDILALKAGSTIAEINCDSYKTAIAAVPNGHAIGFMPYDTSDGLAEVKWHDHYAFFLGLFKASPIFESRNAELRAAFINETTTGNARWIQHFQFGLGNVPRLVVSGSDAHRFKCVSTDNERRGYGDFPSGKATWIKADPTFRGLLQAIREPAKRSYIGRQPEKLAGVETNKAFYVDSVSIARGQQPSTADSWLDGCKVPLNSDLVAIIGNKGSGKSALADSIALLGNSRQGEHFSFLRKHRFRGKSGDPAKHFVGKIRWRNDTELVRNLNDDPPAGAVERIRYIPQGHFESLCNEHATGGANAFEQELRKVIFAHTGDEIRLGALDFEQLAARREGRFRDEVAIYRKELSKINENVASIEDQMHPSVRKALEEKLAHIQQQISDHDLTKPAPVPKPSEQLAPDQQAAAQALELLATEIAAIDGKAQKGATALAVIAKKVEAIQAIRERARLLRREMDQFRSDSGADLTLLGIEPEQVVVLMIDDGPLASASANLSQERARIVAETSQDNETKMKLIVSQAANQAKLKGPQLAHQTYLSALETWESKLAEITGTAESPETLRGVEAHLAQLDLLPQELQSAKSEQVRLCGVIFSALDGQRESRELLFKPVQDVVETNPLIRDEYRLQFRAMLGLSTDALASQLFALIKQNAGDFRGDDESYATIRKVADAHDVTSKEGATAFVSKLRDLILDAAKRLNKQNEGIASVLRKDRLAAEVYNLLFGLTFLDPRYTLLFQDTEIEQLSPGQRGALLLIFYLLVDKERNPIILDQPEENLDNQTVVSLLVPVLAEAKKKRQIIMVTHNPNLAVVCDAEQVIHSSFDRRASSKITYISGAIENPTINKHVVDVLEGTKPAFDNRRGKYH